MLYCPKCRAVCDNAARCPNCRNTKLRPVDPEDMVLLHSADLYTAQQVWERLSQEGIACKMEDFSSGPASYFYDSQVMPTDKSLFVPYRQLEEARVLSAQVGREVEREMEPGPAEPPGPKRIVGEILSVVLVLLLIMAAVFGADAAANWLKGLFT